MTEPEWDAVIAVHLKGAYCVTQPAVKLMKENNYGRVIFTSSTSGLFGNFGQTNYGAAKMGVFGIMNTLKLEVAKYNIKINTIAPTAWSRMTEDIMELLDFLSYTKNITVIIVGHNLELLRAYCNRIVCINKVIAFDGEPKDPDLDKAINTIFH